MKLWEPMTRWDEMMIDAAVYCMESPIVWKLFVKFAFIKISEGYKVYSSDGIFVDIRYETQQPHYELGEEFKVNNNHSAYFARWFMDQYPEHDGFFRTREQPSKKQPALRLKKLKPKDYDPDLA